MIIVSDNKKVNMNEAAVSDSNSSSNSTSGSALSNTDEQPPTKKMKTMPNIAEELAKNRSPPLSNSHNNVKKQISISSLLSDPQPLKPVIRAPTIILPSQRPGTADIGETAASNILIARTKSPVSVLLDRAQSNVQTTIENQEGGRTTKPVSSIDGLLENEAAVDNSVESNRQIQGTTGADAASADPPKVTGDVNSSTNIEAAGSAQSTSAKDLKAKVKVKEETTGKVAKSTTKNARGTTAKSGRNTKGTTARNRKEPVKKDTKAKQDNKSKQDGKVKSESPAPSTNVTTVIDNTPEASSLNESKPKSEPSDLDVADGKDDAKKDKLRKKKVETPRKLVPAPTIKSPKITSVEVYGKPIVVLDIPLHDVSNNDYLNENGQVVFNVYNLIQEKYGSQLNKTKRNLMVDLNDDVEAAEDNEGEDAVDIEHGGDEDDDDDDDDDEEDDDEVAVSDPSKIKDSSISPKKKRPNPLKGKSRIGKYDIEDPFIDDSELLWEEQRAATRDGFFVYFGPLIEKGQYASFQRVDGTMKKGGIKNPK